MNPFQSLPLLTLFSAILALALLIGSGFKARKSIRTSILLFLLAIFSFPLLGFFSSKIERKKLDTYISKANSETLRLEKKDWIPAPVPDDQNIWAHPFFKVLADASRKDQIGYGARMRDSDFYESLNAPKSPESFGLKITYPNISKEESSLTFRVLEDIHEYAIGLLISEDGTIDSSRIPQTWREVGALILEHYKSAEAAIRQLEEAIARPHDHYPYQWDDGFEMLLPHLSLLKSLTLGATLRSRAAAAAGDERETFRQMNLALQLVETGDSDLLISRLVQFSQVAISLGSIRAAQQFHIGTEADWAAIAEKIDRWNFPETMANAIRCERFFVHTEVSQMMDSSFCDIQIHMTHWMTGLPSFAAQFAAQDTDQDFLREAFGQVFRAIPNFFLTDHARAFVMKDWQKALNAYEILIAMTNTATARAKREAWNACMLPPMDDDFTKTNGIFVALLLPALDRSFDKSIGAQHRVELAKVAIALERHYLAHHSYPENLAELAPNFLSAPPMDPMTGEQWKYTRLGTGFRLYSFGKNGKDDGGVFVLGESSDDLSWFVAPSAPPLPHFELDKE